MLVVLAISLAVSTVSAQYGGGAANNPPAAQPSYSSNNIYYPPAVYDSHYWDYSSRERDDKQCPQLTTYVGEFPGIPDEAFYPPVIRYVKYGRRRTALIACDRSVKSINILFARYNSSRDIRKSHLVALGSTAGVTLSCDRDERRYEGIVIDLKDNNTANGGDFSKKVEITQLTCLGLDKTVVGIVAELGVKLLANNVAAYMDERDFFGPAAAARKKREAVADETPVAETTETPEVTENVTEGAVETTQAAVQNTDVPSVVTENVVQNTDAPAAVTDSNTSGSAAAPAPGTAEAIKASIANLGKILGQIF
uniref:Uncharacterized protein n=1 Tax=Caenorhabditis tropicalis TaxID=1561998 RepID=A0A1I7U777_9PELO